MIIRFRLDDYYEAMDYINNNYIDPFGSLHYMRAFREPGQQIYAYGLRIKIPDADMSIREGICTYRDDDGDLEDEAILVYPLDEKRVTHLEYAYSNTTIDAIVTHAIHKNNGKENPWCFVDTGEFSFEKPMNRALPPKSQAEIIFATDQERIAERDLTEAHTLGQSFHVFNMAVEQTSNSKEETENPEHSQKNPESHNEIIDFLSLDIVDYLNSIAPKNPFEDNDCDTPVRDLPCVLRIHDQTGFEWLVIGVEFDEIRSHWVFELGFNNYWEDEFLWDTNFQEIAGVLETPLTADIVRNKTIREMMDTLDLSEEESFI